LCPRVTGAPPSAETLDARGSHSAAGAHAATRSPVDRFFARHLGGCRTFHVLNIVDDCTRECLAIEVDRSLPGARVVRVPERLAAAIAVPQRIVLDNRPEFAGRTLDASSY